MCAAREVVILSPRRRAKDLNFGTDYSRLVGRPLEPKPRAYFAGPNGNLNCSSIAT
jgi:hypothetical protein